MTREEKCKLAIERGYTYDPETGLIYNKYGKIVKNYDKDGYIRISTTIILNKKINICLKAHQFAWYWINKKCVESIDHINGIKNDNRYSNLRPVTHQQNQWNHINAKGYTWSKKLNKWQSKITLNYKTINLGHYNSEQEARNAYLSAKEIYHKI